MGDIEKKEKERKEKEIIFLKEFMNSHPEDGDVAKFLKKYIDNEPPQINKLPVIYHQYLKCIMSIHLQCLLYCKK